MVSRLTFKMRGPCVLLFATRSRGLHFRAGQPALFCCSRPIASPGMDIPAPHLSISALSVNPQTYFFVHSHGSLITSTGSAVGAGLGRFPCSNKRRDPGKSEWTCNRGERGIPSDV